MKMKITLVSILIICSVINAYGQTPDSTRKQLPRTNFTTARGFYSAKNYPEAIANFEQAIIIAKQAGDTATADTSKLYLSAIYTHLGNTELNNDSLTTAQEYYNRALSYRSRNHLAYYGLGQIYLKQQDLPKMKDAFDKAIANGGNDKKTISNAMNAAASAYQKAGALALQSNKFNEAVGNLKSSLAYSNTEPRTYFYLAIAYNRLTNWDEAIASGKKALELESGDKSDIYYQLGYSYGMKGNKAAACDAFKKVETGSNVEAARYQREKILKCIN